MTEERDLRKFFVLGSLFVNGRFISPAKGREAEYRKRRSTL